MREAWNAVVGWMREHAPHLLESLAPPASEEEIRETERALRVRFPAHLKWLYRRHNACTPWYAGVPLDGAYWLPLAEVRAQWAMYNEVREDGLAAGTWTDFPGTDYAKGSWVPKWVVITSSNGGGWGHWVDLAPGPQGDRGQVLLVFPDDASVADESLPEWLLSYVCDLQAGKWLVSKAGGLYRQGYPDPAG
jgi:cell wall assembly regulator SMI1